MALLATAASAQQPPSPPEAAAFRLEPDASGSVPAAQIRELLLRVAKKDLENYKQERDYTYVEKVEQHRLDGGGKVKETESSTREIVRVYGMQVSRLIEKDGKPLTDSEAKKEEERIQKLIDKRKNESEEERRKREEQAEKDREEGRKFVLEVADAFNFRLLGSESINGRNAWILEAEPRPGYQPKSREAKMLSKFKGRIWIDQDELQWTKADLTAIDTLSFGWVVARIQKGTHLLVEQARVNDEVWLPKYVQFHVDAKIALLKNYRFDVEQTYRDYKKFRSDSKVTVVGEATPE